MKNKLTIYLGTAGLFALLFFIGSRVYKNSQKNELSFLAKENNEIFVRDHSPRYGNKEAKIYITEFLDPECESCRAFYPQVKSLLKEYDGKVQLVVRYAPFHKNSKIAIRALEAAREQGKYWEALEMLFHYQPNWGNHHNPRPELIFEYLPKLGLDMEKLRTDMKDSKIENMMLQDTQDLRKLNVRGTPTFFVNGKAPENFGMNHLKELIKKEVELHYN
jgi:protein-disulfide isomerase